MDHQKITFRNSMRKGFFVGLFFLFFLLIVLVMALFDERVSAEKVSILQNVIIFFAPSVFGAKAVQKFAEQKAQNTVSFHRGGGTKHALSDRVE